MEHELGLTALFNDHLAGAGNAILSAVGMTAAHPARPWENWIVMEILVVVVLMILALIIRASLSAADPGKLQHLIESVYEMLLGLEREVGIHHPEKYVNYFGTLFIFILAMNLIGAFPAFESPTISVVVPAGLAVCTFLYYNAMGFAANGPKYLLHFAGPVWWMAWLMIPIELVSHLARPLSLTLRLYGNMSGGEQVTGAFLGLVHPFIPAIFMALHVFVALLQTYVFVLLSIVYVSMATAHEH
jgi:F-type H+-transporting ATPase subunit a